MRRYPMTPAGHARLRKELRHYIEVERPAIVIAIEEARAHGDLSENAEYDTAKDKQGMIEARIRDFEAKLGMAEIIKPSSLSGDRIMFGATVTLEDIDTEEELVYQLVGEYEADLKVGRVNLAAPIGRALMGKEIDDEVIIAVPKGTRTVVVTAIEYK